MRARDIDQAHARRIRAEQGCKHSAMIHSTNIHNMSRAARAMNTTIFVKNAPCYAGLGFGRRRLYHHDDRHAHRRGRDKRAVLYPLPALRTVRGFPDMLTADGI